MSGQKQVLLLFVALLNFPLQITCDFNNDEYVLDLVNIVFRHGSRTPEKYELYPNDPYTFNNFRRLGYGQLTNKGKGEAYQLGKLLHRRYEHFLDIYRTNNMVYAQSTNTDRTKMTALLVLAGLLPPMEHDRWSDELNWAPNVYNYERFENDFVLSSPLKYCPAFASEYWRIKQSSTYQKAVEQHSQIFSYISDKSGRQIKDFNGVVALHQTLDAQRNMNLTLPKWTKTVFPKTLKNLAVKKFIFDTYTPTLKRLYAGRLLKLITNRMMQRSLGTLEPIERKVFLYSGHDNNIAGTLLLLDIFDFKYPDYASAITFDLYRSRITDKYSVKVSHIKNAYSKPEEKIIPGCQLMCPLEKFYEILEPLFYSNYTQECESSRRLNIS